MTTAVVFEADDARLYAENGGAGEVIALTPNAQAALDRAGIPFRRPSERLDDRVHAETEGRIAAAQQALAAALAAADDNALCQAARQTLHHDLRIVAGIAYLSRALLDQGPWTFHAQQGPVTLEDPADAHRRLVADLHRRQPAFRQFLQGGRAAALTNLTGALAARVLARRDTVAVTGYHYGLRAIGAALETGHPPLRAVQLRNGGRFGFLRNLGVIAGLPTAGSGGTLCVAPKPAPAARRMAADALAGLRDRELSPALDLYGAGLAEEAGWVHALTQEMTKAIARMRPRAVLAHSLRWGDEAALGEAAQAQATPCILASHGSHACQDGGAAASSVEANADGLLTSPFASLVIAQSPHAERLAQRMTPETPRLRLRPVMWGHARPTEAERAEGPFHFLHAGTFKRLTGPRPFLYETADEYVAGLAQLVAAIAGLKDVTLTIRVRNSPECSVQSLEALLPEAANVAIKSDGAFVDDLARADALVSFASTTIEEALAMRRPVLLWGGTQRYRHLPASDSPPSPEHRAAVYAPPSAAELPGFLAAIKQAHGKARLSDAELADHVWPDGTPGVEGLRQAILAGERAAS